MNCSRVSGISGPFTELFVRLNQGGAQALRVDLCLLNGLVSCVVEGFVMTMVGKL